MNTASRPWTMPTTPAGINKRLEMIAAGKGLRMPTSAHPFAACFGHSPYGGSAMHVHRANSGSRLFRVSNGGKRYDDAYGPVISCAEYIRDATATNNAPAQTA